jgi:site-specific DNA-methyltransferase (adenine-specific)
MKHDNDNNIAGTPQTNPPHANDNRSIYGFPAAAIHHGDCLEVLKTIPGNSVHLCVTDPPYFIKGLGDEWTSENAKKGKAERNMCRNLPSGMAFDPSQGLRFQTFMAHVSAEVLRVLVPGAFFISFSHARLYHRLAVAVEDAGFEMRDMLAWKYEGQPKAQAQDYHVRRMKIADKEKARIIAALGGRKLAMLKPQMEPMTLAQKPREGTYVENWLKYGTGLADTTQTLDGMFPGNVMDVKKPTKAEKGNDNDHPTVKPVSLIEHLIRLFSVEGQTILDPFLGSGSHGVAAVNAGRSFIGIERDAGYHEIARNRIIGERAKAA